MLNVSFAVTRCHSNLATGESVTMPNPRRRESIDTAAFHPVIVVGAARSGTTLLTVMLDRHSRVSMPPETQFFTEYLPQLEKHHWSKSVDSIVDSAVKFQRIADLGLEHSAICARTKQYGRTPAGLFRALLECYAEKQAASRVGEKTPGHNAHVDTIIKAYPYAKIIALVRDGRAVVNSKMSAPWAIPGNPRRFWLFCWNWVVQMRLIIRHQRRYGTDKILTVNYEDLVQEPQAQLKRICRFIDEPFEPRMLDSSISSDSVPDWEEGWKAKAKTGLDTRRLQGWRKERSQQEIWAMNTIMGPMLRRFGYTDANLADCPIGVKAKLLPLIALRLTVSRPIIVTLLRGMRAVGLDKGIASLNESY